MLRTIDNALEYVFFERPALFFAVLVLAAGTYWAVLPSDSATFRDERAIAADGLNKLLTDRPYINEFPVDPRKTYQIYLFTKQGHGAYITAQNFKQIIEIFMYSVHDGKIRYFFPNAKLKGATNYSLKSCRGPGTFDLKLTLREDPKSHGRTKSYYSWKKYKPRSDEKAKAIESAIAAARARLAALNE